MQNSSYIFTCRGKEREGERERERERERFILLGYAILTQIHANSCHVWPKSVYFDIICTLVKPWVYFKKYNPSCEPCLCTALLTSTETAQAHNWHVRRVWLPLTVACACAVPREKVMSRYTVLLCGCALPSSLAL